MQYEVAINNVVVKKFRTLVAAKRAFDSAGNHWKVALIRDGAELYVRWATPAHQ